MTEPDDARHLELIAAAQRQRIDALTDLGGHRRHRSTTRSSSRATWKRRPLPATDPVPARGLPTANG